MYSFEVKRNQEVSKRRKMARSTKWLPHSGCLFSSLKHIFFKNNFLCNPKLSGYSKIRNVVYQDTCKQLACKIVKQYLYFCLCSCKKVNVTSLFKHIFLGFLINVHKNTRRFRYHEKNLPNINMQILKSEI